MPEPKDPHWEDPFEEQQIVDPPLEHPPLEDSDDAATPAPEEEPGRTDREPND